MVVLNRIYTRTGDDGTTALGTGERRSKADCRIAAYGTVDETNAAIGLARLTAAAVPAAEDKGGGRWPPRPGIAIRVEDDGPGIPAEHIPRLTERFYRVSKGRSLAVGGTGLGLAIVKHVVNRHRGRLAIESKVGEGSRFIVWLPQRER